MNKMNITDLINIAGTDNICKQQMKRKPAIEKEYRYSKMEPLIFKTNFIIKLNDFPYNVEDNIIHYVLLNLKDTNQLYGGLMLKIYAL